MVADRYRGWETIHIVMDNYSTHTSNQTDGVIEELDGKIKRHFLPPYSPEANRIERVWWDVHDNVTRNHRCDDLEELLEEVYNYLRTRSYEGIDTAALRRAASRRLGLNYVKKRFIVGTMVRKETVLARNIYDGRLIETGDRA